MLSTRKYAYQISGSSCGHTACKAFLAFVQQGTHVFLSQLNTEMNVCRTEAEQFQSRLLRSETDCHEERQTAVWLTSQNMSLNYNSCTSLRDSNEELRKSLDDNRSTLLEYLGQEFEEMLQWEESECFASFSCEPSPILNICGLRRTPSSSLGTGRGWKRLGIHELVSPSTLKPCGCVWICDLLSNNPPIPPAGGAPAWKIAVRQAARAASDKPMKPLSGFRRFTSGPPIWSHFGRQGSS